MSDIRVEFDHVEDTTSVRKSCGALGYRHYQCMLMFFSLFIFLIIRTSLSVAIIEITAKTPPNPSISTYPDWDNADVILSSFVWGYIIPQIGAGQLGEYFGPKWFLVTTMTLCSLAQMAIPPMAAWLGSSGVIICRVFQGLNQGFLYPSIQLLLSRWTPLFERARFSNFVYGGGFLGTAVAMPIAGTISGSDLGWPAAFYITGGMGVAWAGIFAVFAVNSASEHRRITEEEKQYIQSSNSVVETTEKLPTPWLSIVKSPPVWAILIASCGNAWGGFTLLTEIPTYLSNIMKFDIKSNSLLSALPYIAQFLLGMAAAPLADKVIKSRVCTLTTLRKFFEILATLVPAAALMWLAFVDSSRQTLGTVLLVVSVGFCAFIGSGYLVNSIDIAPNHAGTIMGIANGIGNVFSILGPITVGCLGSDKEDPILWRKVFLLAGGCYTVCGLFYAVFGSGELQSWNGSKAEQDSRVDKQENEE